jgi:uncharacterized membrane protein YbhN (UPF0104 family)
MALTSGDFLKWYTEEVTRYRNMEWQLSGYSIAISCGALFLFTGKVDLKPFANALASFVCLFVVGLAFAQVHCHLRLNYYRDRRESLILEPDADTHKLATTRLFRNDTRDTLFLLCFLLIPAVAGAGVVKTIFALG